MIEKITELTKDQEDKFDYYVDKWITIGIEHNKPLEKDLATEHIKRIYNMAKLNTPNIQIFPSPYAMLKFAAEQEIENGSKKSVKDLMQELLGHCGYGQNDAYWLSFYDFCRLELGLKEETEELVPLIESAEHLHWWLPYDNVCFISERPTRLIFDDNGNLHCTDGPAMEYQDGFNGYYLAGLEMPDWIFTQPKAEVNLKDVLAISNAEIRMQAMKFLGLDRFKEQLKVEVLDTWLDYELWVMEIEGIKTGPYLKMKNPSTGEIHVEGCGDPEKHEFIDPTITDCKQALAFKWNCSIEHVDKFFSTGCLLT